MSCVKQSSADTRFNLLRSLISIRVLVKEYKRVRDWVRITKFVTNEEGERERERSRETERKDETNETVNTSLFGADVKPLHR